MRYLKVGLVNLLAIHPKHIYVEGAWAPVHLASPTGRLFQALGLL